MLFFWFFPIRQAGGSEIRVVDKTNSYALSSFDEFKKGILFKDLQAERFAYRRWKADRQNVLWQCVTYARYLTGMQISGIAYQIPTNSNEPAIGGIVKTNEGSVGHLAVIIDIDHSSRELILEEANLENNLEIGGAITSGRKISMDSPLIEGYINPLLEI